RDIKNPDVGARIMSLHEPTKKMSKSDENAKATIYMTDTPKKIEKKIQSAVTDSEGIVKFDKENKAGVSNFLTINAACHNISITEAEATFDDKQYGDFKKAVAEDVTRNLTPN